MRLRPSFGTASLHPYRQGCDAPNDRFQLPRRLRTPPYRSGQNLQAPACVTAPGPTVRADLHQVGPLPCRGDGERQHGVAGKSSCGQAAKPPRTTRRPVPGSQVGQDAVVQTRRVAGRPGAQMQPGEIAQEFTDRARSGFADVMSTAQEQALTRTGKRYDGHLHEASQPACDHRPCPQPRSRPTSLPPPPHPLTSTDSLRLIHPEIENPSTLTGFRNDH